MAVKNLIAKGIGFTGDGVKWMPTHGMSVGIGVGTFSHQAINGSLLNHFASNFAAVSNVAYDVFFDFDPKSVNEWVEVSVDTFDHKAFRKTGKEFVSIVVNAHIWVKQSSNTSRALEVAESVAKTFDQAKIAVQDFGVTGDPTVGWISMAESATTDLTRETEEATRSATEHLFVSISGFASET